MNTPTSPTPLTRRAAALASIAGLTLALAAGSAAAQDQVEIIYSKIADHPTSIAPGVTDPDGDEPFLRFRAFETPLVVSPDGTHWMLRSRFERVPAQSSQTNLLVHGVGSTGTKLFQFGDPVPGLPGETYDFNGSDLGRYNTMNDIAFTIRTSGGQRVMFFDGENLSFRFGQGTVVTGVQDTGTSGDETFGNSVGSIHLLDDGRIGSLDTTLGNVATSRRPVAFYDLAAFQQTGVDSFQLFDAPGTVLWAGMSLNSFYSSADGSTWLIRGRGFGSAISDQTLVVNGVARIQRGEPIPGDTGRTVDGITFAEVTPGGDWYARGSFTGGGVWAVVNGDIVAATGSPIFPGADENWGGSFLSFHVNDNGDWVLAGTTDNPDTRVDTVLVLNGERVVLRENDIIPLDGFAGTVFLGQLSATAAAFLTDSTKIGTNNVVYSLININDGTQNLNLANFGTPNAFIRITLDDTTPCPADFDGDGTVNTADITAFLSAWFADRAGGTLVADFNDDGQVTTADITAFLSAWFDARAGGC